MAHIDVPVVALGFRTDAARRQLVGAAAGCVSRSVGIHCLFHLGGPAGAALPLRTLSLAFLFAGIVRP